MPGSKLRDEPPTDGSNYGKYGFDEDGFLTTSEIFIRDELSHIGFSKTRETLLSISSIISPKMPPSCIQRLFFENVKKIMLQCVQCNGRSSFCFEHGNTLKEQVAAAFNDGHSAIFIILQYQHNNNVITSADGLNIMPGLGQYFFKELHTYENNKLATTKI